MAEPPRLPRPHHQRHRGQSVGPAGRDIGQSPCHTRDFRSVGRVAEAVLDGGDRARRTSGRVRHRLDRDPIAASSPETLALGTSPLPCCPRSEWCVGASDDHDCGFADRAGWRVGQPSLGHAIRPWAQSWSGRCDDRCGRGQPTRRQSAPPGRWLPFRSQGGAARACDPHDLCCHVRNR